MNIFKIFKHSQVAKIPYLGGEKAPRPYRDWYILVVASFVCLLAAIGGYGYLVVKLTKHEVVPQDVLIERSLSKIKPGSLEKITIKIEQQEESFLQLAASSTSLADPSR